MIDSLRHRLSTLTLKHVFFGLTLFLLLWRIPYYGKFVLDDPFITFRYGYNLVHHAQFTYNLGEYVLATTTPVYGLIAAGIEALSLPVALAAMLLNLACEIALLFVLGRLVDDLLPRHAALAYGIAGLLMITNRAMSIASNSGMETPLFVLLNFLTLWAIIRGRWTQAAVAGSLATLTRPDGIFVLIVLAVTVLLRERRLPLREVLLSLLIGLPWLVIATLTYGLPIPQSVLAKSAITDLWEPAAFSNKLSVVFYEPLRVFGLLAVPPLLWGLRRLGEDRPRSAPLLLFTALNLIIGLGLAWLWEGGRAASRLAKVCVAGLLVGIAYSSAGNYLSVNEIDTIWRDGMFRVVAYLNQHAPADSVVQSTNIGILGYDTHLRILDPLGLASPEATALVGQAADLHDLLRQTAAALQPDYIVSFGPEDYAGYIDEAEFPTSNVSLILYRRADLSGG